MKATRHMFAGDSCRHVIEQPTFQHRELMPHTMSDRLQTARHILLERSSPIARNLLKCMQIMHCHSVFVQ